MKKKPVLKWMWICPKCGSHAGEVSFDEKVTVSVARKTVPIKKIVKRINKPH